MFMMQIHLKYGLLTVKSVLKNNLQGGGCMYYICYKPNNFMVKYFQKKELFCLAYSTAQEQHHKCVYSPHLRLACHMR